jgi:hypothetical protein
MSDTDERQPAPEPGPIIFTRADPTDFVLLVARVGPGTGNVDPGLAAKFGAKNFKPSGTEYAMREDMREAGYVAVEGLSGLLHRAYEILAHPDASPGDREYQEALGHLRALDAALSLNVSRETVAAAGNRDHLAPVKGRICPK